MSEATTKAALMTEHRDYIDGYAAGLADGRRIAPQPAAPVVSDEQIRTMVESIQDPDTVPAFHNGYYTLTPDELRRAILALRTAVEPMTDGVFDLICGAIDKADTVTMECDYMMDSDDCIAVVRVMQALLSVRGITAKAEDAHQPTKEAK